NLIVEVPDVGDDGPVLHGPHVIQGYDVAVAGGGDEDVGSRGRVLHGDHFVALHGRLQGANRIDFRDKHPTAGLAQRGGGAFAHVTVTRDHGHLAGHHDVGTAPDPIDQALTTTIEVIELRLGDRIVDVDGGPEQCALLLHFVESVHAGG